MIIIPILIAAACGAHESDISLVATGTLQMAGSVESLVVYYKSSIGMSAVVSDGIKCRVYTGTECTLGSETRLGDITFSPLPLPPEAVGKRFVAPRRRALLTLTDPPTTTDPTTGSPSTTRPWWLTGVYAGTTTRMAFGRLVETRPVVIVARHHALWIVYLGRTELAQASATKTAGGWTLTLEGGSGSVEENCFTYVTATEIVAAEKVSM